MKNPLFNFAILAALLSIMGKMLYHLLWAPNESFDMYTRFFYLLCFLAALFFGMRSWKAQNPTKPFTEDIKSGMKIVSLYALLISPFTWLYYEVINPTYFRDMINSRVTAAEEAVEATEQVLDVDQVRQTAELIFNPFTHSSLTLFGLIFMGLFYTIIIVMLFRWKPKVFGILQ